MKFKEIIGLINSSVFEKYMIGNMMQRKEREIWHYNL